MFNEGAAQVANLLQRDEAELTGKTGIGAEAYEAFGQEAGVDTLATVEDFPDAFKPSGGEALHCCVQTAMHTQTSCSS